MSVKIHVFFFFPSRKSARGVREQNSMKGGELYGSAKTQMCDKNNPKKARTGRGRGEPSRIPAAQKAIVQGYKKREQKRKLRKFCTSVIGVVLTESMLKIVCNENSTNKNAISMSKPVYVVHDAVCEGGTLSPKEVD